MEQSYVWTKKTIVFCHDYQQLTSVFLDQSLTVRANSANIGHAIELRQADLVAQSMR
jgi:hypothetical protein